MRRTTALIVGGGPAGSAAAIGLARGGARPLLIERSAGPHDVVCGAFLGWDALAALDRIGIDAPALGAPAIERLRLCARGSRAEVRLPHRAAGLSRSRLDEAMLARAAEEGAGIERGVAARHADHLAVTLQDGTALAADALFLATGKHELRGVPRPRIKRKDPVVGLRIRLDPAPALRTALAGVIELHLFGRGYAGLLLQEDGSANLCLSVAASRLTEASGKPDRLLAALEGEAPILAERFGAASGTGRWLAVSGVPYGWRASSTRPGLFRLGDQAGVIASLAGDGVAIALDSGRLAADYYLRGGPDGSAEYQRSFSLRAARPIHVAGGLRTLAESPRLAPPLVALFGHIPAAAALLARLTRIGR